MCVHTQALNAPERSSCFHWPFHWYFRNTCFLIGCVGLPSNWVELHSTYLQAAGSSKQEDPILRATRKGNGGSSGCQE